MSVVNCGVYELAIALELFVVTVSKSPTNPITNPTPSVVIHSRGSIFVTTDIPNFGRKLLKFMSFLL
jgi:hypothetical protein